MFIAFFFEVGFVLMVIPWSVFWDRNYFAQVLPPIEALITNNFVRGAVSGLGLINVSVGLAELMSVLMTRSSDRPSIKPSQLAED